VIGKTRQTRETRVELQLQMPGSGSLAIASGLPFLDHLLHQLAFHGQMDLGLDAQGDLAVDDHHLVEDIALTLGSALRDHWTALGAIQRYGQVLLPMDEVLVLGAIDVCGRPWFSLEWQPRREQVGGLALEMIPHFFQSFATALGCSLHLRLLAPGNHHHMVEACFKTCGRLLAQALQPASTIPSTKGGLWPSA
jgi:imidazoleglycerol phosphate dehydratase HisB